MSDLFEVFSPLDLLAMRRRGSRPAGEVWVVQDRPEAARIAALRSWVMGPDGPFVVFTEGLTTLMGLHDLDVVVLPFSYSANARSLLIREVMLAQPRSFRVVDREDFETMVAEIIEGLEALKAVDALTRTGRALLIELKGCAMEAMRHG